jgi:hypothetical protein
LFGSFLLFHIKFLVLPSFNDRPNSINGICDVWFSWLTLIDNFFYFLTTSSFVNRVQLFFLAIVVKLEDCQLAGLLLLLPFVVKPNDCGVVHSGM